MSDAAPTHEDRILDLEERRSKREKAALVLSIVALLISGTIAVPTVLPTVRGFFAQEESRAQYLDALIQVGGNGALKAYPLADPGSPAMSFATAVSRWQGALDSDPFKDGHVNDLGNGKLSLCLPEMSVPLFPTECVTLSNFNYAQNGKVESFSIDGMSIGSVVRMPSSHQALEASDELPVLVFPSVGVLSPDGKSVTLIYEYVHKRQLDEGDSDVTDDTEALMDVTAYNATAEIHDVDARVGPQAVEFWGTQKAAIQVPSSTGFFHYCWDRQSDHRLSCGWIYATGIEQAAGR